MEYYNVHKYLRPIEANNLIIKENFRLLIKVAPRNQIIYVHAPAGYGKTTAILLCLKRLRYITAWFTTDKYDNDLVKFCKGFLFSIANVMQPPNNFIIAETANHITMNETPVQCVLEILSNIAIAQMPDAIVIDDFHLSQNPDIENALLLIQKRLSKKTLLIIISRKKPTLSFYEASLKNTFYQITLSDLTFSIKDTEKILLKNKIIFAEDIVEKIQIETTGWPIAISYFIYSYSNNKEQYLDNFNILNDKEFYDYLKTKIYDSFDEKTKSFLIKTSLTDTVDLRFCKEALNFNSCEDILSILENDLGLATKINVYKYKYNSVFKKFLNYEFELNKFIDKRAFYLNAAKWYSDHNQYFMALEVISKSDDIDLLNDVIKNITRSSNEFNIEEYLLFTKPILNKLNRDNLNQHLNLYIHIAWLDFLSGELNKMKEIVQYLHKRLLTDDISIDDIRAALLIIAIEPNGDSWKVIKIFEKARAYILNKAPEYIDSLSKTSLNIISHNLPFFHKAQRDYADIAPFIEEYLINAEKMVAPFLGEYYEHLHNLLAAGIFYEKGELQNSLKILKATCEEITDLSMEIHFCNEILFIEILFAKGLKNSAYSKLNKLRTKISDIKAKYLNKNLRAYEISQMLYNGDEKAAKEWLVYTYEDINLPIQFPKCFQKMITVMALIVSGELKRAIELLDEIIIFCKKYFRWIDIIEALALCSICYHKLGKEKEALKYLSESILLAQKLLIIMPLVLLGRDIIILLKKILNKMNKSSQFINLNKNFVLKVFTLAKERSYLYKGFFENKQHNSIKLSNKQELVLSFLAQGLSYKQIGEMENIKINTVRDHIKKLYQKLEVNNSVDAISKAKDLGIL